MKKQYPAFLLFILFALFFSCMDDSDSSYPSDAESDYSGESTREPTPNGEGPDQITAGQITAGEWQDLEHWNFWNNLMQNQDYSKMHEYWEYDISKRISVHLENPNGQALPNIKIDLLGLNDVVIWETRTDNFGNAELWPKQASFDNLEQLKLRIAEKHEYSPTLHSQGQNVYSLDLPLSTEKNIEIAFVVDATGSMGDELEYLKTELVDVITKVKSQHPNAGINLGSVFYRDQGDDYVTRISDLSSNVNKTISFIQQQSAHGGGDFPEAVHTALQKSINELQWSSSALSRVIFLLLDAPPHYNKQVVSEIHSLIRESSAKGIKIIPITASGIDKETEFLMRYFAISTNGTYVFITNHSGIGNDHLEPSVGEYEVEYLNDLLVRLIGQYLE